MEFASKRCFIRPFQKDDLDAFTAYRNDLVWMRYQGFKGLTKEAYAKDLLAPVYLPGGAQLAIIEQNTGKLLGDLYIRQEDDTCWIGYTIAPENARKGYALEAVTALLGQLAAIGITCVNACVMHGNVASAALLQKLGFTMIEETKDEKLYSLPLA